MLVAPAQRRELEAERVVLVLEPGGADAEQGPAREITSSAVTALASSAGWRYVTPVTSVPRRTALGAGGERGEQRVGLEHLLLGAAEHRQLEEVVHHEHGVEAGLLGGDGLGGDALEQLGRGARPDR